jgi:general secretion pathway protein E
MQNILETVGASRRSRIRLHVAPEGIAITRRKGFSNWEEAQLIPFTDVQSATAVKNGWGWSLQIVRASGPMTVGSFSQAEARWAADMINEELAVRARRSESYFNQPVLMNQFPQVIDHIIAKGDRDAAAIVDFLLLQAVFYNASDVHFEPFHTALRVRFRIDGILWDAAEIPIRLQPRLLARIKILARLAVYRKDVPQEGRTVLEADGRHIDLRVSILPTIHGEKAVARIFDSARAIFPLDALGVSADTLVRYKALIDRPQGTILLTGPANSGKTTTLYSTLKYLSETRRNLSNIVTVEDPVEYDLQVVSQTQTNAAVGLNFAAGLRTVLRQDPEVIMVGEIRDPETAEIAIRAGLTGHLIFSSVHARSAVGVFARLLEMGIEPFLVASSISGVMEQRLVRKLCPNCHGSGCANCQNSGFAGRTGIFSLVTMDEKIRELIMAKAPLAVLEEAARRSSRSLMQEGLDKVQQGITNQTELARVVQPES